MKRTLALLLSILIFTTACASSPRAHKPGEKPKSFVTPWEYYQRRRPAVLRPEDEVRVQNTEVHSTGEDTDSDKTNMIIIGTLVGVVVIGGTVAGILLTR